MAMHNKEYRPTLAQLRTFVTIAENKHFGTAAAKLHISQPSLSQALVALEQGLGVQLIERSTRRVIVTPMGESLLPLAKATLEASDAFLIHSRGAGQEMTGPLTIGIIPTIAPYLLPDFLPRIRSTFPLLEPRIVEDRTSHLLDMLRDGQLDIAILALPSEAHGIVDLPLYRERFIAVMPPSHPLAGRCDLTLASLDELNLLLLDEGHCLHDQILDLCRRAQVSPSDEANAITRASSLTTIVQLVASGFGATLVPLSAVSAECDRPDLATAQFAPTVSAERQVGLLYRGSTSRRAEFQAIGTLLTESFETVASRNEQLLASTLHT